MDPEDREINDKFLGLIKIVKDEKSILRDILNMQNVISNGDQSEINMLEMQEREVLKKLDYLNSLLPRELNKLTIAKPLVIKDDSKDPKEKIKIKPEPKSMFNIGNKESLDDLEKLTLERVRKNLKTKAKDKKEKENSLKPSTYVKISNKLFSRISSNLSASDSFRSLKRDLIKSKIMHLPNSYISLILFSTLLTFIGSILVFLFFLFFNISFLFPFIIPVKEDLFTRLFKVFWIPIIAPIFIFTFMYFYPALEAKSAESKINFELPFATINMSAISNSMIEPSKIFEIIVSTKEYPYLEKEFMRLNNSINIYGYDLVSALRNVAFTTPSKKLSELFNGLATTITSGGDLPKFFGKRAETLLFDYKLEREKSIKSSETFMDIYISVVIAAPMILMLLLMMLKISGLGVGFSTSAITLIMALGVTGINIVFLTFLHLKQPNQ